MSVPDRVELNGVPETMLWTLHNRASEARRRDGVLRDPDAVRIYESIADDYSDKFGKPDGTHAIRSRVFDDALKPWIASHPRGTVVGLGEGLETQCLRCDDGKVRWLSVDVPEAIRVRERFIKPTARFLHIEKSALDLSWMDDVDAGDGVFVTAQGLFMYFAEADVRRLVIAIVDRFPGVQLMFDTIPRWFSKKTLEGFGKTPSYRAPPMPWGINRTEIERVLRSWSSRISVVETQSYGQSRGLLHALLPVFANVPVLKDVPPTIARVSTSRHVTERKGERAS